MFRNRAGSTGAVEYEQLLPAETFGCAQQLITGIFVSARSNTRSLAKFAC